MRRHDRHSFKVLDSHPLQSKWRCGMMLWRLNSVWSRGLEELLHTAILPTVRRDFHLMTLYSGRQSNVASCFRSTSMNWGWLRVQQKHDLLVDVPHFDVSKKCAKPPLVIDRLLSFLSRWFHFAYHLRTRVYAIYRLYIMRCIYYIYSISSLCVLREMVYLQILSLHLPMDYVLWYCFLFMRFSDLKNKQALFEKDERLIFKRFEKICLLSKQISMKTSLWDFSSLFKINKSRNGTFNFVPTTPTLFALRVLFVLEVSSLVPFIFLVQVRVGGNSSIF